jgi:aspartyl-tRNA(Asn)/glutamyl-tRNA(Gln) amidotransferase subunit C
MSKLNRELFQSLSELSRINISEQEQESIQADLKKILDYVGQLQEVDTENVKPCNHVLEEISNVMREDLVKETLSTKTFLDNTPEHIDGMVKVPPVIRKSNS